MLKHSVFALAFSCSLFAATPLATLTATAGSGVTVNGKPLQTAGAPNWPLAKGDQILTGTAGAVVSFPDGARLTLAPNTKVVLKKCDLCVMYLFQGSIDYSTPAKPNLEFCALGHAVRPAASSEGSVIIESPSKVVVKVAGQEQVASAAKCSCNDKKAPIIWATAGGAGVAAATVAIVTASSK